MLYCQYGVILTGVYLMYSYYCNETSRFRCYDVKGVCKLMSGKIKGKHDQAMSSGKGRESYFKVLNFR